jgi:microcystin degradation protein MlrC
MVGIYPTSRPPLRGFVDSLKRIEKRPGVLSVSFGHGFPFADLPHVGAKMLVITDNDRALAHELARDLGKQVYALREQIAFSSLSLPLEDALSKALDSAKATVVVADQSDNPGGGAPGDATYALHWLLKHKARDVAMAIFYDPEVVRIAKKAGQNAVISVRLGGKLSRFSGSPVDIDVTVIALRDNYTHPWPQRSGEPLLNPLGDVASLRHGGIDLIVSSARCQCFTPSIFTDLGIDPVSKRLLVVKSTQHFQAAFAPLDPEPIYMAGPGAVSPNPERIPYMRLNTRRLYPWVPDPLEN